MRRLITLVTVLAAALLGGGIAMPAQAKVPGPNGQIVFGRFNPDLGDFQIFTANPDGTSQVQVLPGVAECPRWSPDGTMILICIPDPGGLLRPATIHPNGSGLTLLDNPDPTLNLGCWAWAPDGARLACEGWDDADPSRPAGIFTVRSSDGGGLVRVTANPYGTHDVMGDYSPGGGKIVFLRNNDPLRDPNDETGALFVVNTDGTGLHRITAWNFADNPGSWSPDGQWILFSSKDGKVFVVHPDGSGLRQIVLNGTDGRYFAYQPTWSPDGTQIVLRLFLTSTSQQNLYTMRSTGSDLRLVANTQDSDEFVDWGPHPLASSKT